AIWLRIISHASTRSRRKSHSQNGNCDSQTIRRTSRDCRCLTARQFFQVRELQWQRRLGLRRNPALSQLEVPRLGDETFSAEAVVRLFCGKREAGLLVEMARGEELALGPQRDLAVASLPRKADAFVDEAATDTITACRGLDVEQS